MQPRGSDRLFDLGVTLTCWLYFTLGFIVFFSPFYIASGLFSSRKTAAFQRYNRAFYRGFFFLLRHLAPQQHWQIDPRIGTLRGAIVVCNHRSYLDPLLLIAQLQRATTVVKSLFFTLPIFGWVIRTAGYIPATATGRQAGVLLAQLEEMPAYFAAGGTLFIFPEGTRSRDGRISALHPGALKLARRFGVPVHVLSVKNTERLFTPGTFLFAASSPNAISLRWCATIPPQDLDQSPAELGHRMHLAMTAPPDAMASHESPERTTQHPNLPENSQ